MFPFYLRLAQLENSNLEKIVISLLKYYCIRRDPLDIERESVFETTGLKSLLQQGITEPVFYGGLVNKIKRIVGKPNFGDQFNKIVKRYIRVGYNLDIMRQSACLLLSPITVYSYGFLFNCTTEGQALDSMTALT